MIDAVKIALWLATEVALQAAQLPPEPPAEIVIVELDQIPPTEECAQW